VASTAGSPRPHRTEAGRRSVRPRRAPIAWTACGLGRRVVRGARLSAKSSPHGDKLTWWRNVVTRQNRTPYVAPNSHFYTCCNLQFAIPTSTRASAGTSIPPAQVRQYDPLAEAPARSSEYRRANGRPRHTSRAERSLGASRPPGLWPLLLRKPGLSPSHEEQRRNPKTRD
jgi:hypothetical protein